MRICRIKIGEHYYRCEINVRGYDDLPAFIHWLIKIANYFGIESDNQGANNSPKAHSIPKEPKEGSEAAHVFKDLRERIKQENIPGATEEEYKLFDRALKEGNVFYAKQKINTFYELYNSDECKPPAGAKPFSKNDPASIAIYDNIFRDAEIDYDELEKIAIQINEGKLYFKLFSFDGDVNQLPESVKPLLAIPEWEHTRIKNQLDLFIRAFNFANLQQYEKPRLSVPDSLLAFPGALWNWGKASLKNPPPLKNMFLLSLAASSAFHAFMPAAASYTSNTSEGNNSDLITPHGNALTPYTLPQTYGNSTLPIAPLMQQGNFSLIESVSAIPTHSVLNTTLTTQSMEQPEELHTKATSQPKEKIQSNPAVQLTDDPIDRYLQQKINNLKNRKQNKLLKAYRSLQADLQRTDNRGERLEILYNTVVVINQKRDANIATFFENDHDLLQMVLELSVNIEDAEKPHEIHILSNEKITKPHTYVVHEKKDGILSLHYFVQPGSPAIEIEISELISLYGFEEAVRQGNLEKIQQIISARHAVFQRLLREEPIADELFKLGDRSEIVLGYQSLTLTKAGHQQNKHIFSSNYETYLKQIGEISNRTMENYCGVSAQALYDVIDGIRTFNASAYQSGEELFQYLRQHAWQFLELLGKKNPGNPRNLTLHGCKFIAPKIIGRIKQLQETHENLISSMYPLAISPLSQANLLGENLLNPLIDAEYWALLQEGYFLITSLDYTRKAFPQSTKVSNNRRIVFAADGDNSYMFLVRLNGNQLNFKLVASIVGNDFRVFTTKIAIQESDFSNFSNKIAALITPEKDIIRHLESHRVIKLPPATIKSFQNNHKIIRDWPTHLNKAELTVHLGVVFVLSPDTTLLAESKIASNPLTASILLRHDSLYGLQIFMSSGETMVTFLNLYLHNETSFLILNKIDYANVLVANKKFDSDLPGFIRNHTTHIIAADGKVIKSYQELDEYHKEKTPDRKESNNYYWNLAGNTLITLIQSYIPLLVMLNRYYKPLPNTFIEKSFNNAPWLKPYLILTLLPLPVFDFVFLLTSINHDNTYMYTSILYDDLLASNTMLLFFEWGSFLVNLYATGYDLYFYLNSQRQIEPSPETTQSQKKSSRRKRPKKPDDTKKPQSKNTKQERPSKKEKKPLSEQELLKQKIEAESDSLSDRLERAEKDLASLKNSINKWKVDFEDEVSKTQELRNMCELLRGRNQPGKKDNIGKFLDKLNGDITSITNALSKLCGEKNNGAIQNLFITISNTLAKLQSIQNNQEGKDALATITKEVEIIEHQIAEIRKTILHSLPQKLKNFPKAAKSLERAKVAFEQEPKPPEWQPTKTNSPTASKNTMTEAEKQQRKLESQQNLKAKRKARRQQAEQLAKEKKEAEEAEQRKIKLDLKLERNAEQAERAELKINRNVHLATAIHALDFMSAVQKNIWFLDDNIVGTSLVEGLITEVITKSVDKKDQARCLQQCANKLTTDALMGAFMKCTDALGFLPESVSRLIPSEECTDIRDFIMHCYDIIEAHEERIPEDCCIDIIDNNEGFSLEGWREKAVIDSIVFIKNQENQWLVHIKNVEGSADVQLTENNAKLLIKILNEPYADPEERDSAVKNILKLYFPILFEGRTVKEFANRFLTLFDEPLRALQQGKDTHLLDQIVLGTSLTKLFGLEKIPEDIRDPEQAIQFIKESCLWLNIYGKIGQNLSEKHYSRWHHCGVLHNAMKMLIAAIGQMLKNSFIVDGKKRSIRQELINSQFRREKPELFDAQNKQTIYSIISEFKEYRAQIGHAFTDEDTKNHYVSQLPEGLQGTPYEEVLPVELLDIADGAEKLMKQCEQWLNPETLPEQPLSLTGDPNTLFATNSVPAQEANAFGAQLVMQPVQPLSLTGNPNTFFATNSVPEQAANPPANYPHHITSTFHSFQ